MKNLMRKTMRKLRFLLGAVLALFMGSCFLLLPIPDDELPGGQEPGGQGSGGQNPTPPSGGELPGDVKMWAKDLSKNSGQAGYLYQVNAKLLYEGEKCVIYVENGNAVSAAKAEQFAHEYDDKIYDLMVEHFCDKNFVVGQTAYADTLEYSYSLVQDQNKLVVLLLDIKDGYKPGGSYVAGYFDPTNFYNDNNSNYKSMIYVDTNPSMTQPEEMFSTFAHELQHLVNFANSIRLRPNGQSPYPHQMDTWIDEGLSAMAERLYKESPLTDRINWFNRDSVGTIRAGNNFYVWNNYENYSNAILDEYATVYLFFQWLYLQAGDGPALLRGIASSTNYDYRAVTGKAASIISGGGDWETLLRTWMAANYMNNSANQYGYKGDSAFRNLTVRTYRTSNNRTPLFPGEGVYSTINSSSFTPSAGSGTNIRYAGLQKSSSSVNTSGPPYTGTVLLTFNKNTTGTVLENGYLTGASAGIAATVGEIAAVAESTASRSVATSFAPVRIDARDLMRRNNEPLQEKTAPVESKVIADVE